MQRRQPVSGNQVDGKGITNPMDAFTTLGYEKVMADLHTANKALKAFFLVDLFYKAINLSLAASPLNKLIKSVAMFLINT